MGKFVLLLRLEGPLQSWGTRSRWDVRDSASEPTKSGVIGLLGCALGLARGDETLLELDQALRFGVRTEAAGRLVTDYQTITDYLPTAGGEWRGRDSRRKSPVEMRAAGEKPSTIISPRDYLEDAAFLAGFEARGADSEGLLARAALALQAPRWPLFLGRKCCVPTRPIYEFFGADYEDLRIALQTYDWSVCAAGDQKRAAPRRPLGAWIEGIESDDGQAPSAVSRQDALRRGDARVYDFRFAVFFEGITPPNLSEVSP